MKILKLSYILIANDLIRIVCLHILSIVLDRIIIILKLWSILVRIIVIVCLFWVLVNIKTLDFYIYYMAIILFGLFD
jgi:hypothetical protein